MTELKLIASRLFTAEERRPFAVHAVDANLWAIGEPRSRMAGKGTNFAKGKP